MRRDTGHARLAKAAHTIGTVGTEGNRMHGRKRAEHAWRGNTPGYYGQTSIEYLVLFAIALVIVVVLTSWVTTALQQSSALREQESARYWESTTPIAIWGQQYAGTQLQLDMENTLLQTILLEEMEVEGIRYNTSRSFGARERNVTALTLPDCGMAGGRYVLDQIRLYYSIGNESRVQMGRVALVGQCG